MNTTFYIFDEVSKSYTHEICEDFNDTSFFVKGQEVAIRYNIDLFFRIVRTRVRYANQRGRAHSYECWVRCINALGAPKPLQEILEKYSNTQGLLDRCSRADHPRGEEY